MRNRLLALLLLALALPCHAYQAAGIGLLSCGKVVTDLRGNDQNAKDHILFWFEGYITGRDAEMELRAKGRSKPEFSDTDAIRVFIENYCGANPLEQSAKAAEALWNSFPDK